MTFPTPDYNEPCAGEITLVATGRRYSRTRGGFRARSWKPGKAREAHCRRVVFTRDDFACQEDGCTVRVAPDDVEAYDGHPIYGLQLDHYPVAYRDGGLFYPGNLRTLCPPHNYSRGAGS